MPKSKDALNLDDATNLDKLSETEGADTTYVNNPEQEAALKQDAIDQHKLSEPVNPEELDDNPEIVKANQEAEFKLEQAKSEARAKLIKSIAIVGVDKKLEDTAKDQGAYEMTEDAKRIGGLGGFWRKMWKHGLWRDAAHFEKQRLAQKKILTEKNIFANATDDEGRELTQEIKAQKQAEFAQATTERFLMENKDLVEEALGEKVEKSENQDFNEEIKNLIKDFASGNIEEAAFIEEKNRLVAQAQNNNPEMLGKKMLPVDNILEVAREIKELSSHQAGLEALEFDINLTLGKAEGGIKTQGQFDGLERIIKKITSNPIGAAVVSETGWGAALIASTVLLTRTGGKMAISGFGKVITFGLGVGLASAFAYKREGMRTEHDREIHGRELASKDGDLQSLTEAPPIAPIKPDSFANKEEEKEYKAKRKAYKNERSDWEDKYKRRLELEPARYKTARAEDLINNLKSNYNEAGQLKNLSQAEFNEAVGNLSDVIARNNLANEKKVDLINYSSITSIEPERTELLKTISRLKVDLKRYLVNRENNGPEINNSNGNEEIDNLRDEISQLENTLETTHDPVAFRSIENQVTEKKNSLYNLIISHQELNKPGQNAEQVSNLKFEISQLENTLETTRDPEVFRSLEEQIQAKKSELESLIIIAPEINTLPQPDDLDGLLKTAANTRSQELNQDIVDKDKRFSKIKTTRSAWAAGVTAFFGTTIGIAIQEIAGQFFDPSDKIQTLAEGLMRHNQAPNIVNNFTALEAFHNLMAGHFNASNLNLHEVFLGHNTFNLPEGTNFVPGQPGFYDLVSNGKVVAAHLSLNVNGTLTEASKHILHEAGISTNQVAEHIVEKGTVMTDSQGLIDHLKGGGTIFETVKRLGWLDNDTFKFDLNELKECLKLDSKGDYVFDLDRMANSGSFHGTDALAVKELLAEGKIHILLSLSQGTQNQAISVIPGQAIDHASEVGKMLFANVNGEADFLGKYAEVAYNVGTSADGKSLEKIIATVIGDGIDGGQIDTEVSDTIFKTTFIGSTSWDMFPFVPVPFRRPLEKLRALFTKKKSEDRGNDRLTNSKQPVVKEEDNGESWIAKKTKTEDDILMTGGTDKNSSELDKSEDQTETIDKNLIKADESVDETKFEDNLDSTPLMAPGNATLNVLENTRNPKVFRDLEDQAISREKDISQPEILTGKPLNTIEKIESEYEKYAQELKEREEEVKRVIWDKDKVASFEKAKAQIQEKMTALDNKKNNIVDYQELSKINLDSNKWKDELKQETALASKSGLSNGEKFQREKEKIEQKILSLNLKQDEIKTRMIDRSESVEDFYEALDLIGPVSSGDEKNYSSDSFRDFINRPGDFDLKQIPDKYKLRNKFKKFRSAKAPTWKILS